jgi:fatty acid desaturase
MRVVNQRRWRRAKWTALCLSIIGIFWAMGGLEEAPIRSLPTVLILLPTALALTFNLTKDWEEETQLEEWRYRQRRQ